MAVAATAIAAVLIGVVAAYTYAWSTSPLVYGNAAAVNTGEMTTDPDPGVGQAFQFRFVDGGRIAWGIDVRNNLLIPVTIRGLNQDVAGFNSLTTDRQLNLSRSEAIGVSPDELRPFEAVELAPNQHVFVAVTEVFVDCRTARAHFEAGTGMGRDTLRLDVVVLGVARVNDVALPFSLMFQAPTATNC